MVILLLRTLEHYLLLFYLVWLLQVSIWCAARQGRYRTHFYVARGHCQQLYFGGRYTTTSLAHWPSLCFKPFYFVFSLQNFTLISMMQHHRAAVSSVSAILLQGIEKLDKPITCSRHALLHLFFLIKILISSRQGMSPEEILFQPAQYILNNTRHFSLPSNFIVFNSNS